MRNVVTNIFTCLVRYEYPLRGFQCRHFPKRKHLQCLALFFCNDTYMVIITIAWYFPYNNIFWKFTLRDDFGHLLMVEKSLGNAWERCVGLDHKHILTYKEIKIFGWLSVMDHVDNARAYLVDMISISVLLSACLTLLSWENSNYDVSVCLFKKTVFLF